MRHIKKFESFVVDDNRGEDTQYPEHNIALKAEVTEYVDTILNSNEYSKLVDLLDMEIPKNVSGDELDKFFDDVREKAIQYFIENPEQLGKSGGFTLNRFSVAGNDGIVRTNNVGGSQQQ